jgi:hypothetical protein
VPKTELISADYTNEGYERVLPSDMRCRYVSNTKTLV